MKTEAEKYAEFHGLQAQLANARAQTDEVILSYLKAAHKHAPMRGPHEGYAVTLEELDELWSEIKADDRSGNMRKEATHVAAMALRFLIDVCPMCKPNAPFTSEGLAERFPNLGVVPNGDLDSPPTQPKN